MNTEQKHKILVVLGPTAVGKSDLAVELALKFGGEIVSADSRQVYTGLDIGTGKITSAEMKGVPHHLLDIADPGARFTAQHWKAAAEKAIADIISRGKLPIVCGGTGFYISSLIDDIGFPEVEADPEQQKELEAKTVEELFDLLRALDPVRASTIDRKNKRRLARAIVIARALGAVPPIQSASSSKYDALRIGLSLPIDQLRERIKVRLLKRLDAGMLDEANRLHKSGLSYERMDELGLEYRYLAAFIQGHMTREQMIEKLSVEIGKYAKRQMTWFKKDQDIRWFEPGQNEAIETAVQAFLK